MPYRNNHYPACFICIFCLCFFSNCNNPVSFKSPVGYDFSKPEKFILSQSLHEISGISFLKGKDDTLFAIQDEDGKIYLFKPGAGKIRYAKFGKGGDYEDVSVLNDTNFVVLRSDGSLFMFAGSETGKEKIDSVHEFEHILPKGEYEGLCTGFDGKLYALCKNCPADKEEKEVSVYTIEAAGGQLNVTNSFKIDVSVIQPVDKKDRVKFHPSCLAKNPATHQWFLISSVNKLLLVLDDQWEIKEHYPLDPALFKQPEGMTFTANGDLYISNEGGEGSANILLFRYHTQ